MKRCRTTIQRQCVAGTTVFGKSLFQGRYLRSLCQLPRIQDLINGRSFFLPDHRRGYCNHGLPLKNCIYYIKQLQLPTTSRREKGKGYNTLSTAKFPDDWAGQAFQTALEWVTIELCHTAVFLLQHLQTLTDNLKLVVT